MLRMNQNRFAQAAGCLSPPVFSLLSPYFSVLENKVQEIRLRAARPLALVCGGSTCYLTESGGITDLPCGDLYRVSREEIEATFQRLCDYSVYARQREIACGYVTLRGGHRAGICGTAVTDGNGIVNVRSVSSINLRVAREMPGCAEGLLHKLRGRGNVLLCGAPRSGKTTLLRDLARLLSTADSLNVSLIDERGELAAVCGGEAQNDVGLCDVFDGYPKAQAIEQALRCMSPRVIICDEIGSRDDAEAVRSCLNSGVRVIAAAHADSLESLLARPVLRGLVSSSAFETLAFLRSGGRPGELERVVSAVELAAA